MDFGQISLIKYYHFGGMTALPIPWGGFLRGGQNDHPDPQKRVKKGV